MTTAYHRSTRSASMHALDRRRLDRRFLLLRGTRRPSSTARARPDPTGRGLGLAFVTTGLELGTTTRGPRRVVVDVAAFNETRDPRLRAGGLSADRARRCGLRRHGATCLRGHGAPRLTSQLQLSAGSRSSATPIEEHPKKKATKRDERDPVDHPRGSRAERAATQAPRTRRRRCPAIQSTIASSPVPGISSWTPLPAISAMPTTNETVVRSRTLRRP